MILLDIETTGLTQACGIWQIGSIDLENPSNYFLQESRIDEDDKVTESALKITGKTEKELRDKGKQSQKQLILNYLEWRKSCKSKINLGQNVMWDSDMIEFRSKKYDIFDKFKEVMGKRSIDLHTVSQEKYFEINNEYFLDLNGKSKLGLPEILNFCGMPDSRISMGDDVKVKKEGTFHSALDDCKLEAECFFRIKKGQGLFPEYTKFKIPDYLLK